MIDILTRNCMGCSRVIKGNEQTRLQFTHKYGEILLCKRCVAELFVTLKDYIYSKDELRHELLMVEDEYNLEW